jgi:hypothetical protein
MTELRKYLKDEMIAIIGENELKLANCETPDYQTFFNDNGFEKPCIEEESYDESSSEYYQEVWYARHELEDNENYYVIIVCYVIKDNNLDWDNLEPDYYHIR